MSIELMLTKKIFVGFCLFEITSSRLYYTLQTSTYIEKVLFLSIFNIQWLLTTYLLLCLVLIFAQSKLCRLPLERLDKAFLLSYLASEIN